jgi:hypothetical protein
MAKSKGYENFHIEVAADSDGKKTVLMDGVIDDPKLARDVRLLAAKRKITVEAAFRLMLETGARTMTAARPVDGQHAG